MSEEEKASPNGKIDKAILKLLKECEGDVPSEKAESLKIKTDILRVAMTWEKIKHGINLQDEEGTQWNGQQ